jgi:hypothetical protein
MKYIVVDMEGATRLSFERLSAARDWAYKQNQRDPELLAEALIERYNADGQKVGISQWADEFLRELGESMVPFERGDGSKVLSTEVWRTATLSPSYPLGFPGATPPPSSWIGRAKTNAVAFCRSHEHAIGTPSRALQESLAG